MIVVITIAALGIFACGAVAGMIISCVILLGARHRGICAEAGPDPLSTGITFHCTQDRGHRGNHVATGPDGEVFQTWSS